MAIKMICIDLDGTLFGKNHCISDRTRQNIKKAYEKGIKVIITTGRIFINAAQVRESLGINCPIISSNGATIIAEDLKTEIFSGSFAKEQCLKLANLAKQYKVTVHFYTKDKVIANNFKGLILAWGYKHRNRHKQYKIKVGKSFGIRTLQKRISDYGNEFVKCVLYSRYEDRIEKMMQEVKKDDSFNICGAGKNSAEITLKNVSKGNAIKILAQRLKIDQKDIMAIGDNENDIQMLKYAGVGVAMGNAVNEVKEIADFITDTNINDGVAKAIEKYVL